MSTQDNMRERFKDTLREFTGCAYCGAETDAPCCGENHQETLFDDGDEIFPQTELTLKFEKWLSAQPEPAEREPTDSMTLAKNYAED